MLVRWCTCRLALEKTNKPEAGIRVPSEIVFDVIERKKWCVEPIQWCRTTIKLPLLMENHLKSMAVALWLAFGMGYEVGSNVYSKPFKVRRYILTMSHAMTKVTNNKTSFRDSCSACWLCEKKLSRSDSDFIYASNLNFCIATCSALFGRSSRSLFLVMVCQLL
jgi:hypothetical protein